MARLNTRHQNGELMMFSDFTGGLNLSKPPETIADNELAEALNFEFAPDTGMLRTRGGLAPVRSFPGPIDDIIPISGDVLFVKHGGSVSRYSVPDDTVQNTWDLDDAHGKPAAFDFWGDSFQVVMAFGGHLWQSTEDGALEQIAGNGIAWTERAAAVGNWRSVCHGDGLFVAVGPWTSDRPAVCMTSPDGINWTERLPSSVRDWRSVCHGDGLFVAVHDGSSGMDRCMTSPDGINWTNRTCVIGRWASVCHGDGLFVAVGWGGKCMTSPDGITWTERTAVSGDWLSVCWGDGLFVAVSYDGKLMTSPDGIDWTQRTAMSAFWRSVCHGNGLFVAVGDGGAIITSPDGINWMNASWAVANWRSVCYGNGFFVAVSDDGKYLRSDGIDWSTRETISGQWQSVCYGNGIYAAVGTGGKAMTGQGWGELPSEVEQLFIRDGRVFLIETDSDTLKASGVGDLANWRQDTDADSISVDIGYKDGCDMRAVVEFAGEMIAFKAPPGRPEWGRVYRLQGKYPDWSISLYSRGNSTWNARSAVNIPNDVLFLSKGGMMSLGTVTEYGDFKIGWAGSKVNAVLAPTLTEDCRMWHLPSKGQAWASDGVSNDIWAYHYQLQAWTKLAFGGKVSAVFDDGARTYIGMGDTLYVMSGETPCEMPARLRLRTNVKRNQQLIKGIIAGYGSDAGTEAKLRLGGYELALPHGGQLPGGTPGTGITRARCNIRDWQAAPEINVTGGAFSLASLGLEVAEV